MKKLFTFVNEGRPAGSKNKPKNQETQEAPELKDVKGLTEEDINENSEEVAARLAANKPFFIQGEAGWGKTSIITDIAHKFGRTVITVYLDKAQPEDLGGLPTAEKNKHGEGYQANLLPGWAQIMRDNPKTDFLLFFDEMNQAQPDVMNALMPIVLKNTIAGKKFKNFVVGAAGNFEEENKGGISKLSGPLESRFGGVIKWISGDWAASLRFLRKKYHDQDSIEFIDKLEDCVDLFKNPRDVEQFIIEYVNNIKKSKYSGLLNSSRLMLKGIKRLLKTPFEEMDRGQQNKINKLAELMSDFIAGRAKSAESEKRGRKTRQMMDKEMAEIIKDGIQNGYMTQEDPKTGEDRKYGISRENIRKLFCDEKELTAEMLDNLIDAIEIEDKIKFKYETDAEWKADGYEDPANELILGKNIKLGNKKEKHTWAHRDRKPRRSIKEYVK